MIKDDVSKIELRFEQTFYSLHDLWTHKNIGTTEKSLIATIPSHDVLMFRLKK